MAYKVGGDSEQWQCLRVKQKVAISFLQFENLDYLFQIDILKMRISCFNLIKSVKKLNEVLE